MKSVLRVARAVYCKPVARNVGLLKRSSGNNCGCCGIPSMWCSSRNYSRSKLNGVDYSSSLSQEDVDDSNKHLQTIIKNNRDWVNKVNEQDPEYFKALSQPQKPKYLYFGCSDSRVPANQILGLGPGEVFVHRNVGNLVPGNDLNALSVLEFAVGFLGVTDILVVGHYGCGAIKHATQRQDLGMLENWLRQIRDVYRLHREYLDLITNEDQLQNTLVELNVIEQCLNIFKTGIVQRKRIENKLILQKKFEAEHPEAFKQSLENNNNTDDNNDNNNINSANTQKVEYIDKKDKLKYKLDKTDVFPRIHGMVFNPATGLIRKIPIDFKKRVGSLDHIYGLYSRSTNKIEK